MPSAEFSDFLYAPIGEQRNGTPISVLSAFARLDRDPWPEAERLARLPRERAVRDMAGMIAGVPGVDWRDRDAEAIAARLVERLPKGKKLASPKPVGLDLSIELICALTLMWLVFALALAAFSLDHYRKTGVVRGATTTAPAAVTTSKEAPRPAWWRSG